MESYAVGEKVYLKDEDDESDIVRGEIVKVCEEERKAYVMYETDYYLKHRWVTFEELEYCMDVMLETSSWF